MKSIDWTLAVARLGHEFMFAHCMCSNLCTKPSPIDGLAVPSCHRSSYATRANAASANQSICARCIASTNQALTPPPFADDGGHPKQVKCGLGAARSSLQTLIDACRLNADSLWCGRCTWRAPPLPDFRLAFTFLPCTCVHLRPIADHRAAARSIGSLHWSDSNSPGPARPGLALHAIFYRGGNLAAKRDHH